MRTLKQVPDWAPKDAARWPAGFTPTKDGWVKWYKGRTRFACGKGTPLAEVPEKWWAKKKEIDQADDAAARDEGAAEVRTYREVLTEFLAVQKAKVGAKKGPRSQRTYHNYVVELNRFGNFRYDGRKVADSDINAVNRPPCFTAYALRFNDWAASGFDSVVSRVSALFRWAERMEYVDRYRPGPEFVRPEKREIRDQRIDLVKSYPMEDLAKMWLEASDEQRCWVALGLCGGMNNSDVSNLPRTGKVVDLASGTVDYRRRKSGKKRRVIPLPPDVVTLLKGYVRPAPSRPVPAWGELFFLSNYGLPYTESRTKAGGYAPNHTFTKAWSDLEERAGVAHVDRRGYSGVRTTAWNAWPRGQYELERKIVFGRDLRGVDMDNYLEDVGLDRLRHCVNHVWGLFQTALLKVSSERLPRPTPASPVSPPAATDGASAA